jgi:hypothetical protein|nr:MAG TPA: hypothetical protein [Caudoviricetes sp.]
MNIAEILKHCPKGTKLYSLVDGEVTLENIISIGQYTIEVATDDGDIKYYTKDGSYFTNRPNGECVLFPSKEQRDWSKFNMNTKVNDEETECQLKQSENVLVDNDIEQNYKRIPFNVELAKKIVNGKVKGRIVTMEGRKVRIVCWDKKPIDERAMDFPIVALLQNDCEGEMLNTYTEEGLASSPNYKNRYNLIIEIPTYYRDYSNFMPQKWQACIVRNFNYDVWVIRVCCGKDSDGGPTFFNTPSYHYWNYILPLNNVTERLVGTTENYEQLIQELDAESTATAKNEQQ